MLLSVYWFRRTVVALFYNVGYFASDDDGPTPFDFRPNTKFRFKWFSMTKHDWAPPPLKLNDRFDVLRRSPRFFACKRKSKAHVIIVGRVNDFRIIATNVSICSTVGYVSLCTYRVDGNFFFKFSFYLNPVPRNCEKKIFVITIDANAVGKM